jgi:hypothetical protein
MEMTEPLDHVGTPHYRTSATCSLLRILNPRGGRVVDLYGPHRAVPAGLLTPKTAEHYLDHGMIEHVDAEGRADKGRYVEILSAIIACDCEKDWGRPRIAERLRANGFKYNNRAISVAVKMWHSDWKLGDPIPETG